MRIALLVVLAFAGVWFAVLRPKPVEVAPPAPAPAAQAGSGVTGAPEKAEDAVARANGSAAAKEAAASDKAAPKADAPAAKTDAAAPKTAEPAKAAKPAAAKPLSPVKRVLADLDAERTAVLLFWDRRVSDDREVRRAVNAIDRHDGKVRVHVASIGQVGRFEAITNGVPVVTSPTVLVIGKDRRARVVTGLTVTRELDELVVKALDGK
jgi:hypothetical protein